MKKIKPSLFSATSKMHISLSLSPKNDRKLTELHLAIIFYLHSTPLNWNIHFMNFGIAFGTVNISPL